MLHAANELLLHVCCAPCATSVIEALKSDYRITAFFYNPNIQPSPEYHKRREQVECLCRMLDIRLILPDYDADTWVQHTAGLTHEPEGGSRCSVCFDLRLARTIREAQDRGITTVATTLTVSPHKDAPVINAIGSRICAATPNIRFLGRDFKKKDGYRRSCELSKTYGLYRQSYCGCLYSMPKKGSHGSNGSYQSL